MFDCFLGCICWETRIPEIVFHQKQTTRPNLASENKPCRYKGSLGFVWQKQTGFNKITLVYLRVFSPANSCATSFVPEFAGDPQSVCCSRHGNEQTHPFGLECRFSNLSSKRCVFPSGHIPFFPAKTFVLAVGQFFSPHSHDDGRVRTQLSGQTHHKKFSWPKSLIYPLQYPKHIRKKILLLRPLFLMLEKSHVGHRWSVKSA